MHVLSSVLDQARPFSHPADPQRFTYGGLLAIPTQFGHFPQVRRPRVAQTTGSVYFTPRFSLTPGHFTVA